ncbi:MAG: F0F1 ATP synthase subunit A [Myxococcota bacterium]
MFASGGFSWFRLIPWIDHDRLLEQTGLDHHMIAGHAVPNMTVYVHAWLAVAVLIVFALIARMGLDRARKRQGIEQFFPDEKVTPLAFAEVLASGLLGLMGDLLDKRDARLFFPIIAGIFTYIFACNIQSVFPGFLPPTDNINTNAGMAILVFLLFNFVGLTRDPVGYIKHLAGPALFLAPFILPLEILSLCIRPLSLTLRLTANLFGDHLVFGVMSGLVPPVFPTLLLMLACVVSTIQAFVFALLTVIYLHLAIPHHEHDEGHGAAPAH